MREKDPRNDLRQSRNDLRQSPDDTIALFGAEEQDIMVISYE